MKYSVLEHHEDGSDRHYDLLVEQPGGELRTWRLKTPPSRVEQIATALEPHRNAYLKFEGPVYPGRGWVRRWDQGSVSLLLDHRGRWHALMRGERLHGLLTLETDPTGDETEWRCRYIPRVASSH